MVNTVTASAPVSAAKPKGRQLTYLAAIREAQYEEMTNDPNVILLGEDIEAGMFGSSGGLRDEFGPARVRDTPISELGFCGAAVGMAMTGLRPIVDLSIATFTYAGFDAIVSQAAKSGYMFGAKPTSIDAALYGFIANIYFYDIDTPLKECLMSKENLVAHCKSIHAAL